METAQGTAELSSAILDATCEMAANNSLILGRHDEFKNTLRKDSDLARLHVLSPENNEGHLCYLIAGARNWAALEGDIDIDAIKNCLNRLLMISKNAVKGKPSAVPLYFCFDGSIPPEEPIHSKHGAIMRVPETAATVFTPNGMPHRIVDFDNLPGGFVFRTEVPVTTQALANGALRLFVDQRRFQNAYATLLSAAVSIATANSSIQRARYRARSIIIPFETNGLMFRSHRYALFNHALIPANESRTIKCAIDSLLDVDTSGSIFAIDRLYTLINEREMPIDTIVDGGIGLENLFWAERQNAKCIQNCIRTLFHEEAALGEMLATESHRLYKERSDIVHANRTDWTNEEVKTIGRDMAKLLGRVLHKLLFARPELLSLSSKERTKALLQHA